MADPTTAITDGRLSFAARGLFATICALNPVAPSIEWIVEHSPGGEWAAKSVRRELMDHGYLTKHRVWGERGHVAWAWTIHPNPVAPIAEDEAQAS